jgi:hypothetical protein
MRGRKGWKVVDALLNQTSVYRKYLPILDLQLLRQLLEPSTYKIVRKIVSIAVNLDIACYYSYNENVVLLPRLYMDFAPLMSSDLNELLAMHEVKKCRDSLRSFLSYYLWYILLWIEAFDALVYSRLPGILLETFKAQTSIKSARARQARNISEAVEHAVSMLHYFIKLYLRQRLAKFLDIDVEELNKAYIYYTSILSTYFHEEVSRALQQHTVVRNLTLDEISESIRASAYKLLNEDLLKQHEKLARERLNIVLAKLETYAPLGSETEKY